MYAASFFNPLLNNCRPISVWCIILVVRECPFRNEWIIFSLRCVVRAITTESILCDVRKANHTCECILGLAFSAWWAITCYYTSFVNRAALKKQSSVLTMSFYFHFAGLITLQNKHSNDCKWVAVHNGSVFWSWFLWTCFQQFLRMLENF